MLTRRLALAKETLTALTPEDMAAVAAGATEDTCYSGILQCLSVRYCSDIPSLHCSLAGGRCG